jgi:hypothetical protein
MSAFKNAANPSVNAATVTSDQEQPCGFCRLTITVSRHFCAERHLSGVSHSLLNTLSAADAADERSVVEAKHPARPIYLSALSAFRITTTSIASCRSAPDTGGRYPNAATIMAAIERPKPMKTL